MSDTATSLLRPAPWFTNEEEAMLAGFMAVPNFLAAMSLAGKVTLGPGKVAAAISGTGAAGVLPARARAAVADAVAAATPFMLRTPALVKPEPAHPTEGDGPDEAVL